MDLELGMKLDRVADEFTSTDFPIAKDRAGPLFLSRETDTAFILIAHLKGYKKRGIKIDIIKDGTRIVICGEKAIQETVMVRWKLYKKGTEIRGFRKAFKIPEGVILDKIRGKFDEDKSTLTISMLKKEKGIRGFIVEDVKEQELARGGSETLRVAVDHEFPPEHRLEEGISREEETKYSGKNDLAEGKSPKVPEGSLERIESEEIQRPNIHDIKEQAEKKDQPGHTGRPENIPEKKEREKEMIEGTTYLPDEVTEGSENPSLASTAKAPVVESIFNTDGVPQIESGMHEQGEIEKEKINQGVQGKMEMERDGSAHKNDQVHERVEGVQEEEEEESTVVKPPEGSQEHRTSSVKKEKGRCKLCSPCVAGSALLLSLVVFVIHVVRTKSQPGKRKD